MMINVTKRKAFTLMELAITLVIIGLIAGGVLVGKDLIRAAEIRQIISEQDKIKLAYNTFSLKYNCIPGDCSNAAQFLSGVVNGNGDRKIVCCTESTQVWKQMALAGFIEGTYVGARANHGVAPFQAYIYGGANATEYPTKYKVGAGYRAGWPPSYLYNDYGFFTGNGIQLNGNNNAQPWSGSTMVPAIEAYSIDTKIDDGKPGRGQVEAHNGQNMDSTTYHVCHGGNALESANQRNNTEYYKTNGECTMLFYLDKL